MKQKALWDVVFLLGITTTYAAASRNHGRPLLLNSRSNKPTQSPPISDQFPDKEGERRQLSGHAKVNSDYFSDSGNGEETSKHNQASTGDDSDKVSGSTYVAQRDTFQSLWEILASLSNRPAEDSYNILELVVKNHKSPVKCENLSIKMKECLENMKRHSATIQKSSERINHPDDVKHKSERKQNSQTTIQDIVDDSQEQSKNINEFPESMKKSLNNTVNAPDHVSESYVSLDQPLRNLQLFLTGNSSTTIQQPPDRLFNPFLTTHNKYINRGRSSFGPEGSSPQAQKHLFHYLQKKHNPLRIHANQVSKTPPTIHDGSTDDYRELIEAYLEDKRNVNDISYCGHYSHHQNLIPGELINAEYPREGKRSKRTASDYHLRQERSSASYNHVVYQEDSGDTMDHRPSLTPQPLSDSGVKLGGFLIDVLITTGHVDIHLVTQGNIVQGLDTVASMMNDRYIQIEIWTDLTLFLTHLGPTEGYLSTDQFIVYGSSSDILSIIKKRRIFMDVINTGITTWYYVVLDDTATNQELADALEEGSHSLLLRPSQYSSQDWAAYTLISPGDGTRHFRFVGKWTKGNGLKVIRQLFPPFSTNLWGRKLTIGVINKPRVLQLQEATRSSPATMEGYSHDILVVIERYLNFSVVPRRFKDWGTPARNGSWDGVIGALFRKEIDFSPMDFTPTKESREVIDFSEWVGEDPVVITSAAPQPMIRPFLLLEIYHPWVYVSMLGVLGMSGVTIYLLTWANVVLLKGVYPPPRSLRFTDLFFSACKTVVSQWVRVLPREFSARVFFMMVLSMSLVLDAAYQGHITAFIALPRFTAVIDNHEQLSANKSVIPVTERHSTTQTMIMESERESFQKLAARLQVFDAIFLDSAAFYEGIAVGKWAFVDSYSSTYGRALDYEVEGQRCRFYVSRNSVIGGLDAWPFPRNSPVHSQISTSLKWLRYYGILEQIKSRYYQSRCQTTKGLKSREGPNKMDILMMQSSFYVLGVGCSVGMSVFVAEIVVVTLRKYCLW
ncbi:uncharacterized protein LOC121874827 [Homarus americanus]|uniref:uncharacterized protein LOC121874827 n=1 Tax=Homarus americanus TaxID=6706 RepID=UPI001C484539|nr:uncharacterized protein LOC121874827 [Homarus americanus]